MTESEAIKFAKEQKNIFGGKMNEFLGVAIKALEEVQQYRKYKNKFSEIYGDCEDALDVMLDLLTKYEMPELKGKADYKLRLLTDKDADKWDAYREIGTVEECRESVEKMRPKEPWKERENNLRSYDYEWKCPVCGHIVGDDEDTYFCKYCGQKVWE